MNSLAIIESILKAIPITEGYKVWLGVVDSNNSVSGEIAVPEDGETPTHSGLGYLTGTRWRYAIGGNAIFWWSRPTEEERDAVESFLMRKGYTGLLHKVMSDDYSPSNRHMWDYYSELEDVAHGRLRGRMFVDGD